MRVYTEEIDTQFHSILQWLQKRANPRYLYTRKFKCTMYAATYQKLCKYIRDYKGTDIAPGLQWYDVITVIQSWSYPCSRLYVNRYGYISRGRNTIVARYPTRREHVVPYNGERIHYFIVRFQLDPKPIWRLRISPFISLILILRVKGVPRDVALIIVNMVAYTESHLHHSHQRVTHLHIKRKK